MDDRFDLFEEQQGQYDKIQKKLQECEINLESREVAPFHQRVELMCREPNAFLTYKQNRSEILADKKPY